VQRQQLIMQEQQHIIQQQQQQQQQQQRPHTPRQVATPSSRRSPTRSSSSPSSAAPMAAAAAIAVNSPVGGVLSRDSALQQAQSFTGCGLGGSSPPSSSRLYKSAEWSFPECSTGRKSLISPIDPVGARSFNSLHLTPTSASGGLKVRHCRTTLQQDGITGSVPFRDSSSHPTHLPACAADLVPSRVLTQCANMCNNNGCRALMCSAVTRVWPHLATSRRPTRVLCGARRAAACTCCACVRRRGLCGAS
jgi:hypothetical protein